MPAATAPNVLENGWHWIVASPLVLEETKNQQSVGGAPLLGHEGGMEGGTQGICCGEVNGVEMDLWGNDNGETRTETKAIQNV